jgi:hypothetical protein
VIGGQSPAQLSCMDRSHLKIRVLVALLGAVVGGCHNTPTANLGGFSSSLPGDAQFNQLMPQQIQTFCDEVASFEASSGQEMDEQEFVCLFAGLIAAELSPAPQTNASVQAACMTGYNQCVATPQTTTLNCPSMTALAGCSATVSDYAACINDATKIDVQAIQSLPTCADLTVADLTTSSGAVQTAPLPQSCQTFDAHCSALAIGGSEGTDGGAGVDVGTATDAGAVRDGGAWPTCPPITNYVGKFASNCYMDCVTANDAGGTYDFPSCVTSNVESPGLGWPAGPIYCNQTNNAQNIVCP